MKNKVIKLGELAEMVGGELIGDPETKIAGVADLETAKDGEISFLADAKHVAAAEKTAAAAVIVPAALDHLPRPAIKVRDPYLAVARIHNYFLAEPFTATGIDPRAVVGRDCRIPAEVSVGPLVVIGDRVRIGARVRLYPGVVIGDDAVLGDDVVLHANVNIGARCVIGSRVMMHAGTVIGSDGFSYATDENGRHVKRPHVGIVQIDDDVEIGANVCIDRATFGRTWVKRGTKIDNLVQLAHNVVIGEDSFLVAQVGIAGSTTTGRSVVLGGQVGVSGHIHLGDRVMAAAKSGVHNNLEDGMVVAGIPAFPHKKWLRASGAYAKLPDLVKELREVKKQLAELTKRSGGNDE